MKTLVVAICGDSSLHCHYLPRGASEYDLFVVYYGDRDGCYRHDGRYYERRKGTKFNILADCMDANEGVFEQYDYVFVPDDDIYIAPADINRLRRTMDEIGLVLAQPGIVGWTGLMDMFPVPGRRVRFTNYVEIMAPCFSRSGLEACRETFRMNRTNWGIDWLWGKIVSEKFPSRSVIPDRMGVVDEVVGVHTRPCYFGDTYTNNNTGYDQSNRELREILDQHGLDGVFREYGSIIVPPAEFGSRPSEQKFYPNSEVFKHLIRGLRERREDYL